MPDVSRFRPVLWAVIGVLLTAGVVSVPIVGDEASSDVRAGAGDGGWVGVAPQASDTTTTEIATFELADSPEAALRQLVDHECETLAASTPSSPTRDRNRAPRRWSTASSTSSCASRNRSTR